LRSFAFDRLSACAAVIDRSGVILDTNQAWRLFAHLNGGSTETTGAQANYLTICDRAAAQGVERAGDVAQGLRQILDGEREHFELEYPCPSPIEDRWFLLSASSAPVDAGGGAVVFHVDTTARKLMTDHMLAFAETDALTGLANRRGAARRIEELLVQAGSGNGTSLLFFDIDDFKSVNDTLGHHTGDELLAKVAARAARMARTQDLLCRFGGDEFVMVCPDLDEGQAAALAEQLSTVMAEPFQIGAAEVLSGVSVGVASSDIDSTVDSLLRAADAAMYTDKRRLVGGRAGSGAVRRGDARRAQRTAWPRADRPFPDVAGGAAGERVSLVADSLAAARIVERSPDARIVIVGATIVFVSERALTMIGATTNDEVLGRNVYEFVAPRSRAAASIRHDSARQGIWPRPEVLTLRRLDGQEQRVEVASTPVSWRDQLATQVMLWESSTSFDRIRQQALGLRTEVADAVIVTDLDDLRVQSFNQAASDLYHWTDEEVIGRPLNELNVWIASDDDRLRADKQLHAEGRWHGELSVRLRDGTTLDLLGSTTVVRDDNGTAIGAVIVNRPVTHASQHRSTRPSGSGVAGQVRRGISNGEFVVHYQPLVRLADRVVVGVEALARWQHPQRGLLGPAEFIDAAERSGQIIELGQHVLHTACDQAQQWRLAGHDLHVSVNLSCAQLLDGRMVDRLTQTLAATGLPAEELWLEITETTLVQDLDRATRSLHQIRDLGVSISIDDFGTGWASLTYLRQFPVNALKIDRLFVTGLGLRTRDTAIAHSIVSLAAELGIGVVAEGIENVHQATMLLEMGCAYGQGFFFGHPEPATHPPSALPL
jgi:diguanylate cyclase (GGDEF)-like protein/PAS domain S-box-containing protein